MKCPKCDYLGFETGDRCRNCGYDFSLLTVPGPPSPVPSEPDLELNRLDTRPLATSRAEVWLDRLDETLPPIDAPTAGPSSGVDDFLDISLIEPARGSEHPPDVRPLAEDRRADVPRLELADLVPAQADVVRPEPIPAARAAAAAARHLAGRPPLPLFTPDAEEDDKPLISAARPPRPPLSVRRTPDRPRLRAVPRPAIVPVAEPALEFADPDMLIGDDAPVRQGSRVFGHPGTAAVAGSPARRFAAAAIDHGILLLIDAVVVYLTLRMAMLGSGDWVMLPRVPLLAFLGMIKLAYFYAFTAIGGQTIGKMSAHLRVVSDADVVPEAAQAATRTLAAAVSFITLGLGFLPALVGDRRAFHDRVARTRVVSA